MPIAWHAPYEMLKPETRDMSRAIHSLMEELEAMDWYSQRMDVTDDDELRRLLGHNAKEEKEHAAMLLEWIRRRDPQWDVYLRTYLFSSGDLLTVEERATDGGDSPSPQQSEPPSSSPVPESARHAFTVGSLRSRK